MLLEKTVIIIIIYFFFYFKLVKIFPVRITLEKEWKAIR